MLWRKEREEGRGAAGSQVGPPAALGRGPLVPQGRPSPLSEPVAGAALVVSVRVADTLISLSSQGQRGGVLWGAAWGHRQFQRELLGSAQNTFCQFLGVFSRFPFGENVIP